MSCPDWNRLLAWRRSHDADEPQGWRRALEHLQRCERCRRRALEDDPTLLFQSLPRPAVDPAEAREIKQAVHALRRAGRLEGLASPRPRRRLDLAAAALLAAVLLVPVHTDRGGGDAAGVRDRAGNRTAVSAPVALSRSLQPERLPLIEILDRPRARIYQLGDDEVSVVMIVDETLDL